MSVGSINKETGGRIPAAGNYLDKVGTLASLHTDAKTNAVSAINEVADAVSAIADGQSIDSFADVESALSNKQDTLTFDDTPTDGSNNPVKSNGIYDALATKTNTDMVAADFDTTASYTAGNYCIYEGKFYKFKANHTGAWSASDVDEIKIAGELAAKQPKTDNNLTTTSKDTTGAINELKNGLTNLIKSDTVTLTTGMGGHANTPIPDTVKVLHVTSDGAPCLAFTYNGYWFFCVLTWDASTLQLSLKPSAKTTFTYYYV